MPNFKGKSLSDAQKWATQYKIKVSTEDEFNEKIEVNSIIKHHGRRTMVIASEIKDENAFLLATALTTMSVDGFFDEIPRKW